MTSTKPIHLLRYAYYAFIFSIPIETLDIGIERGLFSLSKLTGFMFIAIALLQPQVCFKKPPRPFWYFLAYIVIYSFLAIAIPQPERVIAPVINFLVMLVMMLVLFWVSYNLLQDEGMIKGTFLSLVGSCMVLALIMVAGGASAGAKERATALSQNQNALAMTLDLGLVAMLGLAYGRNDTDWRTSILVWVCFGIFAGGIIKTGSRGAMLGLLVGILVLMTRQRVSSAVRLKIGIMAFLAVGGLVWGSYDNEMVRLRWEKTFMGGNLAGREEILPEAWKMFTESPLVGWGPGAHLVELGERFGRPTLDPHNLYLWILNEAGLLGAIPFFIGLWMCWRAAWRATQGTEGTLPIALLSCLLIVNMSGSEHNRKLFWLVLAYSLASDPFLVTRVKAYRQATLIRKKGHTPSHILPVGTRDRCGNNIIRL
jgi:O-antigen ligase